MESKTVAAVELSSSKIKGAVGAVDADGHITVLAIEEIPCVNNIRYGRVQNIREVSACIDDVVTMLQSSPSLNGGVITSLALSLGGRSVYGAPVQVPYRFPQEQEITWHNVEHLSNEVSRDFVSSKVILEKVPRMFYVNNVAVRRPVGTYGETLRGDFTIVTCSRETRQNIDRLRMDKIAPTDVAVIPQATAVGRLALSSDERQLGTALVDFGAETTTVSVYKDGTLAFLCTIPMGSRLITRDLMTGLNMTEESAEALKRSYAAGNNIVDLPTVEGYVSTRAAEIVANVLSQLDGAGYPAASLSSVVITGGGTRIADFAKQLEKQGKVTLRYASMPAGVTFEQSNRNTPDNIGIVAMLQAASLRFADDCITYPAVAQSEPRVISVDEFPQVATVYDDPSGTPASGNGVSSAATAESHRQEDETVAGGTRQASPATWRTTPADDDNCLVDDPDPDDPAAAETQESKSGRSRGFFGFGRRKEKKPAGETSAANVFGTPDDLPDPIIGNDDNAGRGSVRKDYGNAIAMMRQGFLNIFGDNEEENESRR